MTAKRDLKRRVRQRQARTGESYVTARRRVLAARGERSQRADTGTDPGLEETERDDALQGGEQTQPGVTIERTEPGVTIERDETTGREGTTRRSLLFERDATDLPAAMLRTLRAEAIARIPELADLVEATADEPRAAGMPVVELHELTGEARALGFRCRITAYPAVMAACELESLLAGLRDALVRGAGDTGTARMFGVAFGLPSKPHVQVVPEPYGRETVLTFSVTGRRGPVAIACRLWRMAPSLMLRLASDVEHELPGTEGAPQHLPDELPFAGMSLGPIEREFVTRLARLSRARPPRLFVVDGERRYTVTRDPFVIGRGKGADLSIREGMISRKHAAVVSSHGTYYLKDLGSVNGIEFKGMRIDNKRIDEGDVFRIGTRDLRFTYLDDG